MTWWRGSDVMLSFLRNRGNNVRYRRKEVLFYHWFFLCFGVKTGIVGRLTGLFISVVLIWRPAGIFRYWWRKRLIHLLVFVKWSMQWGGLPFFYDWKNILIWMMSDIQHLKRSTLVFCVNRFGVQSGFLLLQLVEILSDWDHHLRCGTTVKLFRCHIAQNIHTWILIHWSCHE